MNQPCLEGGPCSNAFAAVVGPTWDGCLGGAVEWKASQTEDTLQVI